MIIFPDIEIQGGRSVNRIRGTDLAPDIYLLSPQDAAAGFVAAGAEWLHLVDIDASLQHGHRSNAGVILEIIERVDVPVQVGGGIRTAWDVEWWLDHGVTRVVLGTAAVVDRHMIMDVCSRHAGEIVVSITGKEGFVMIDGWRTKTSFKVLDVARSFEDSGAAAIIYNDLDSFEGGPDVGLAATVRLGSRLEIPLISTGTVNTLDDISVLSLLPNIEGAIVGRAFFKGSVNLAEAIETARASRVPLELASLGVAPQQAVIPEIPINRIDHVGLWVRDLSRAVKFYESFGFYNEGAPRQLGDGTVVAMRHTSGVGIDLMCSEKLVAPPARIALGVASLSRSQKILQRNRISISGLDGGYERGTIHIKDPDNNVIELCMQS